jgi:very-short-patch-repair endonuclease
VTLWQILRVLLSFCIIHYLRKVIGHLIALEQMKFKTRKRLIIELEGSQHLEQREYDEMRIEFLKSRGYKVIRFWNHDVSNNIDAVLQLVWNAVPE